VLWIFVYYCWFLFQSDGPVDQKTVYSTIQGLEIYYRDKLIPTPFFIDSDNLSLVALDSGNEKFPYIWIALNRENPGDPDGIYKVGRDHPKKFNCIKLNEIINLKNTSNNTKTYLSRFCIILSKRPIGDDMIVSPPAQLDIPQAPSVIQGPRNEACLVIHQNPLCPVNPHDNFPA
jgi:hypothetical protein